MTTDDVQEKYSSFAWFQLRHPCHCLPRCENNLEVIWNSKEKYIWFYFPVVTRPPSKFHACVPACFTDFIHRENLTKTANSPAYLINTPTCVTYLIVVNFFLCLASVIFCSVYKVNDFCLRVFVSLWFLYLFCEGAWFVRLGRSEHNLVFLYIVCISCS